MSSKFELVEEDIDQDELSREAYRAVESATGWLTRKRSTAEAQGEDPFSDAFTSICPSKDDSGYLSSIEGMTAIFQVLSYIEREDTEVYFNPSISEDIVTDDVKWVLNRIDEEGFIPTPYLPKDATSDFTDAVSFTTTTLQKALDIEMANVEDGVLKDQLNGITEWFLNNYITTAEFKSDLDSDRIGYAWCGSEKMDEQDDNYPPQKYFTYSASMAMTDLYNAEYIEDNQKEELGGLLTRLIKGLVRDYWVESQNSGWTEFTMDLSGVDAEPNAFDDMTGQADSDIFSTANTLTALAYMWNELDDEVWENVDLDNEDESRIQDGIDTILKTSKPLMDNKRLHQRTAEYTVEAYVEEEEGKVNKPFLDGTLPYTIINALGEIERADGPFDYKTEDVINRKQQVINYTLKLCWADSTDDIGFKHFNPNRNEDPVVTYATQTAVESLLGFELQPPEDGVKIQVAKELENTKQEITSMLEDHSHESSEETSSDSSLGDQDLVESNSEFSQESIDTQRELITAFNHNYSNFDQKLSKEVIDSARSLAGKDQLHKPIKKANIHEFIKVLNKCYYAENAEEFKNHLSDFLNEDGPMLLKTQKETINQLLEKDEDSVDKRKDRMEIVHSALESYGSSTFDEDAAKDLALEFNGRDW